VGENFPKAYLWLLQKEGIDLSGLVKSEKAETTCFELRYTSKLSDRRMRLKRRAPPITIDDLPKFLSASTVHIAPIAGEINYEIAENLKRHCEILSLDPQGLVRDFDLDGNLCYKKLQDKRILEITNIYKSSLKEIEAVTGVSDVHPAIKSIHDFGVEIVIVTLGVKGAVLSVEGTTYNIPSCKSGKVIDPTGAGDVFIGSFLAEYLHDREILWCAYVGSAAASLVIEAIGPMSLGNSTEIFRRARWLYEKEIKE
jgi:sugar/nucleoside kinase (ribokinase family)